MRLVGVDPAWKPETNGSAIAVGGLHPALIEIFDLPHRLLYKKGEALKANEDALDSLICLYVCGLYAIGASMRIFGDTVDGYVVVPTIRAL
jgi:predicted RNase H-like nuclease